MTNHDKAVKFLSKYKDMLGNYPNGEIRDNRYESYLCVIEHLYKLNRPITFIETDVGMDILIQLVEHLLWVISSKMKLVVN